MKESGIADYIYNKTEPFNALSIHIKEVLAQSLPNAYSLGFIHPTFEYAFCIPTSLFHKTHQFLGNDNPVQKMSGNVRILSWQDTKVLDRVDLRSTSRRFGKGRKLHKVVVRFITVTILLIIE